MKTKIAFAALGAALLLSPAAMAGESEMTMPLPTINVWAAGKHTLSVFGGLGTTNVSFAPRVPYGELVESVEFEDDDITAGIRYAFPVMENLTLEAGFSYMRGSLEQEAPFGYSFFSYREQTDEYIEHELEVLKDDQTRKDISASFGGLYSLASGAESPIHGGLFFLVEGGRFENESSAIFTETVLDGPNRHVVDFAGTLEERKQSRYGVKIGLTADIHVIRDVLRVTPMVGYYYRRTKTDAFVGINNSGEMEFVDGVSDTGGGALYGIEAGYRPGGVDGKWEIVLTPYFKTESRRPVLGQKIEDHRNAVVLTFRSHF